MNKEKLIEQLKYDEGVMHEIYNDHLGYPTFGVGHLVLKDDEEYGRPVGTPVSSERVDECLKRDIETCILECGTLYGNRFYEWPDEIQQILANMMFNMGRPRLSKFIRMNAALEEGLWGQAAVEGRDSKWYRQVRKRAERLMTRLENV